MPNYNPKQENLIAFKPKWESGKTKLYRLPETIAPQVLEYARTIDQGISVTSDKTSNDEKINKAITILKHSLTLRANKGGAIKSEIKKAIEALSLVTSDKARIND